MPGRASPPPRTARQRHVACIAAHAPRLSPVLWVPGAGPDCAGKRSSGPFTSSGKNERRRKRSGLKARTGPGVYRNSSATQPSFAAENKFSEKKRDSTGENRCERAAGLRSSSPKSRPGGSGIDLKSETGPLDPLDAIRTATRYSQLGATQRAGDAEHYRAAPRASPTLRECVLRRV
jgi:hypothetical protein